ncbi:MAG: hypothetical protein Edafosvirus8_5 [Edafosvirus sp.]|uniref:Ankyrin repeat protein n=1 Tax=Edafosvirus sp. TaxID=2487765 RepID=A0A3G4ZTN2_9VIRU|nr:MAG: hypothetical protein Edafosvirus8_5 [Edafosvirus sp.]
MAEYYNKLKSAIKLNKFKYADSLLDQILDKKINIDAQDKKNNTLIMKVIYKDYHVVINDMIIHKFIQCAKAGICNLNLQKNGMTALILALIRKNKYIAHQLIESKSCNLNLQDEFGCTALMYAIRYDVLDIIELLIDYDCDLYLKNKRGTIALYCLFEYPNISRTTKLKTFEKIIVKMDIKYLNNFNNIGNIYNHYDNHACLIKNLTYDVWNNNVTEDDNFYIFKRLYELGYNMGQRNYIWNYTPMVDSVLTTIPHNKNINIILKLIELNCDINLVTNFGTTALSNAILSGQPLIVKKLLSHNVDFRTTLYFTDTKIKMTPFELAICKNNGYKVAIKNNSRWQETMIPYYKLYTLRLNDIMYALVDKYLEEKDYSFIDYMEKYNEIKNDKIIAQKIKTAYKQDFIKNNESDVYSVLVDNNMVTIIIDYLF